MANYYGIGRTNYVKVKYVDMWEKLCSIFYLESITDEEGRYGFLVEDESGLYMPYVNINLEDFNFLNSFNFKNNPTFEFSKEEIEEHFKEHVDIEVNTHDYMFFYFASLLEDNEYLVYMHTGSEKARYLCGYSISVNNKFLYLTKSIHDIYDLLPNDITLPEY